MNFNFGPFWKSEANQPFPLRKIQITAEIQGPQCGPHHCLIQLKQTSMNVRRVGVFLCRLSSNYSCLLSQSQHEEAKKFAEIKRKLRLEIQELRETVLQMMSENQEAPELERLDRHEYNLDVDQRQKLVLEGEEKIKQVWDSNFKSQKQLLTLCFNTEKYSCLLTLLTSVNKVYYMGESASGQDDANPVF